MFSEPATGGTPDEQPGAMPEIFPSPDQGANIDRCWTCRSMFMQAWGNYGTTWAVVHQWLGVRPDLGNGRIEVVPQVPQGQTTVQGRDIRLGGGSADVRATHVGDAYRTRSTSARVWAPTRSPSATPSRRRSAGGGGARRAARARLPGPCHQPWDRGDGADHRGPSHADHHHLNQARRTPPDDEEDEMRSWLRRAVPILLGVALLAVPSAASGTREEAAAPATACGPPSRENFYFVMADRFENGRAGNDLGGLPADRLVSGFDPTAKGFYHGGDLAGIRQRLSYVRDLGTTAIWLTPSFKNKAVQLEDGPSAGYHGYWITDFTQIDPHLGTNAELAALIREAHGMGMKVFFDIITNHTADVIDYEEGHRRLRLQGPGALPDRIRHPVRRPRLRRHQPLPPAEPHRELPLHALQPAGRPGEGPSGSMT